MWRQTLGLRLPLLLVFLTALVFGARAQAAWPERQVKIVVTFPPGSANDAAVRIIADALARHWSKPVVVENKTGAEGTIGVAAFVAANDDHTLLYTVAGSVTVAPLLFDRLPYDPDLDIVPIVATTSVILTLAVPSALPIHSIDDLVRQARERPGALAWTSGPTIPRYTFAAFLKRNGLTMQHVSYRDAALPQADLGEGRIQVLFTSLQASHAPVQSGKARFLAIANSTRATQLPTIPTMREAGYPELTIDGVSGLFGWRGIPDDLRTRIAADVSLLLAGPETRSRLEAAGQTIIGGPPQSFHEAIARQRAHLSEIAKLIDVKSAN